jgi:lysophospholipase L1-like esterase
MAAVRLLRILKMPATVGAVLAGQVMHAAHRSDMPGLENQDPSGTFGDPDGPLVTIALLGDSSITAPGVEPLDAAWPRRMAARLGDRYRIRLVSVARGGSKARDVLAEQVEPALAAHPDLALVSVGANDALRATPVARFEAEMTEILGRLSAATTGVGVSGIGDLGTVPRLPTLARGIGRVRGRSLDRATLRAASRFPNVVKGQAWGPAWRIFEEGDPAIVFAPDRFHASAVGHETFAAAVQPVIDELLRRLDADGRRTSERFTG